MTLTNSKSKKCKERTTSVLRINPHLKTFCVMTHKWTSRRIFEIKIKCLDNGYYFKDVRYNERCWRVSS